MSSPLSITPSISLLQPIITLNVWTLIMETWMYARRIPAVTKHKVPMHPAMTHESLNAKLPPEVRWPADNYNHLLEQPTQFYAVAATLALLGADGPLERRLAWTYVGLRVVHSLIQSLGNPILPRFGVFVSSSFVLAALTAKAGMLLFL